MSMTSSKPYLLRALYDWIVDNHCTPYLLVNAQHRYASVPQDYVNPDGQIILNISPSAVHDFALEDKAISFSARFGGVSTDIYVPTSAILGIYTKENQQGMIFDPEPEGDDEDPRGTPPPSKPGAKARPSLKVVK